jgi:hypothetical protein
MPTINSTAPAMIVSTPAVVGFQVLSISSSPFYLYIKIYLEALIVNTPRNCMTAAAGACLSKSDLMLPITLSQQSHRGDLLAYEPWYDRHARYHGKDHPEYQTYS